MAIPNTNTFSLSQVYEEVGIVSGGLSGCFFNSINEYFNPFYEGNKDRLSNFRDYGSHNYTSSTTNDMSVSTNALLFSNEGGSKTVTVTTYPDANDYFVASKPSWITTSISGDTLTITASLNSSSYRTGTVTVEHNDDNTVTKDISVEQESGIQ